jgi:predicted neuraminidase
MIIMPIIEKAVKQEWNKVIIMARNNGVPEQIVHKLRNKVITKRDRPSRTQLVQQRNKKWFTFTCIMALQYETSPSYSNALT